MEQLVGTISKLKILQYSSRPLVRFTLAGRSCLIAQHSLNFLADATEGSHVALQGVSNARGQFVVKQYRILGESVVRYEFAHSRYPHKNRS